MLFFFYSCAGKPIIFFEKEEYDIGRVKRGQFLKKEITVYNRGKGTLKIERITTSCHCTVLKGFDALIEPSGKGEIVILYDAKNYGYFEQIFEVFSNDEHSPKILVLKGYVVN